MANRIQGELVNGFEALAEVPGLSAAISPAARCRSSAYMIACRRLILVKIVAVAHGKT